jgi:HipA-like protein
MTDTLIVIAGNAVAGTLTRLPGGKLQFDYDEQYATRPGATPLSLSMPLKISPAPTRTDRLPRCGPVSS